jgi:hypothetical protein
MSQDATTLDDVNEKNTCYITVNFFDKDNNAAAPASVAYWLHDDEGNQLATGAPAAAATVEIEIDSSLNAMQDPKLTREKRVLSVKGTYGANDEVNDEFWYNILNLKHIT